MNIINVMAYLPRYFQGVGGIVQFPKGFLQKAYDLVKANGGVCIADEVRVYEITLYVIITIN